MKPFDYIKLIVIYLTISLLVHFSCNAVTSDDENEKTIGCNDINIEFSDIDNKWQQGQANMLKLFQHATAAPIAAPPKTTTSPTSSPTPKLTTGAPTPAPIATTTSMPTPRPIAKQTTANPTAAPRMVTQSPTSATILKQTTLSPLFPRQTKPENNLPTQSASTNIPSHWKIEPEIDPSQYHIINVDSSVFMFHFNQTNGEMEFALPFPEGTILKQVSYQSIFGKPTSNKKQLSAIEQAVAVANYNLQNINIIDDNIKKNLKLVYTTPFSNIIEFRNDLALHSSTKSYAVWILFINEPLAEKIQSEKVKLGSKSVWKFDTLSSVIQQKLRIQQPGVRKFLKIISEHLIKT